MYFGKCQFLRLYRINQIISFIRKMLIVIIVCAVLLCIITAASVYAKKTSDDISDGVVRLHIIPNSNSFADQELKQKVRDAIIKYLEESTGSIEVSKPDNAGAMFEYIVSIQQSFKEIAEKVVSENGYTYNIETTAGNYLFPKRDYGTFSLPSGEYRALRITIGDGIGDNWWCILFPPLCFTGTAITDNQETDAIMEKAIGKEGSKVIKSASASKASSLKIKFKIVEFFGRIHNLVTSRINISGKK